MSQMLSQEKDDGDKIISINGRKDNPLIQIVGKREDGDKDLAVTIDLGEIDHNRTAGADAAYGYLNGHPGQYAIARKTISPKKAFIFMALLFCAGAAAAIYATQI